MILLSKYWSREQSWQNSAASTPLSIAPINFGGDCGGELITGLCSKMALNLTHHTEMGNIGTLSLHKALAVSPVWRKIHSAVEVI